MISEPGFGEWKPQNQIETQKTNDSEAERLSEQEALQEASRIRSKIDRHGGAKGYDEAERIAEAEKPYEMQVQKRVEKMVKAFRNNPMELAEYMRNISPEYIQELARAFRGESYITIFGTLNPENENFSKVQMGLWSEEPILDLDGRVGWGNNKSIAIASSDTVLRRAKKVIEELNAQKIETEISEIVDSEKKSELYKVDTSEFPSPVEPYY